MNDKSRTENFTQEFKLTIVVGLMNSISKRHNYYLKLT